MDAFVQEPSSEDEDSSEGSSEGGDSSDEDDDSSEEASVCSAEGDLTQRSGDVHTGWFCVEEVGGSGEEEDTPWAMFHVSPEGDLKCAECSRVRPQPRRTMTSPTRGRPTPAGRESHLCLVSPRR
jgi:hypothetical protein